MVGFVSSAMTHNTTMHVQFNYTPSVTFNNMVIETDSRQRF